MPSLGGKNKSKCIRLPVNNVCALQLSSPENMDCVFGKVSPYPKWIGLSLLFKFT